ncbi:MAG: MotA/TolQ/ExbB proton channel family protein [Alphaproteobacteria bacterium]
MARPVTSLYPGADCVSATPEPVVPGGAITRLFAAYAEREVGRHDYLLLLRFAVANLVGMSLLGAAYVQGLVDIVIASDMTNISLAIFFVFLGGLAICAKKVRYTSREINMIKAIRRPESSRVARYLAEIEGRNADSRAISASSLRLKLTSRIAAIRHIANSLVFLGLIGTVVGFIIALSGVQPNAAADPSAIGPMVTTLIEGMSVALYTTLVGAVFNVWLMVNYHILATGTVNLVTAIVDLGERRAKH